MKSLKSSTTFVYLIAGDLHHVNNDGTRGHFHCQEFWSHGGWSSDPQDATKFESELDVIKAIRHFDPSCYILPIEM